ncbi:MAG: GDP-mannose 4,6-dehydratase [Planctomycetota bacterium]
MKSLITGITGFVGSHLAERLLSVGEDVVGLSMHGVWPAGTEHLSARIPLLSIDVADEAGLRSVLREQRPDRIYHLAGQANVPQSFKDPEGTWRTNFEGGRHLFDAVAETVPEAKLLFVSTGNIYGQPPAEEMPITEETRLRPRTPYAVSKAAADLLAAFYARERGQSIVIARPFNHIGPRQKTGYAVADFSSQIARLEILDGARQMHVGDLSVRRDITDVRDAVRAYHLLMQVAEPGESFNVASGNTWSLQDLVERLVRLSHRPIEIVSDPELLRRFEPSVIRVTPRAVMEKTGWRAEIPMEQTLLDTLEYWRWRVKKNLDPEE